MAILNSDPINLTAIDCSGGNLTSNLMVCSNGSVIVMSVDISDEGCILVWPAMEWA